MYYNVVQVVFKLTMKILYSPLQDGKFPQLGHALLPVLSDSESPPLK